MATAASTFIPEVIAAGIEKNLDAKFVLVDGCNRKYEGDIKSKGDVVKVRTVGNITANYLARSASRSNIAAAEELDGAYLQLPIDTIYYTNTKVDAIDELTTDVSLADATAKRMAVALAGAADAKVAEVIDGATYKYQNSGVDWALTPSNVINMILGAKETLYTKNVPEEAELELCINYQVLSVLIKAGLTTLTNNVSEYKNGNYGKTLGVTIKVSNNIYAHKTGGNIDYYACCLRVKDHAMAFAKQASKVIHYRDDSNELDADFLKSYILFGTKIMFQDEIVMIPVASTSLT